MLLVCQCHGVESWIFRILRQNRIEMMKNMGFYTSLGLDSLALNERTIR